jgi:heavy-metal resistance protein
VIRWWLLIGLLLSVGLNVGILATIAARRNAPPPEARVPKTPEIAPGKDPLPILPRLADRLGLEGEVRRKFLDIQWNLFQETSRFRLQLGEVHREIRREVTRDEPDQRRIDQLLNESSRIYLALERSLVSNVLATRKLLDPEQERQYMVLIARLRIAGAAAGPALGDGPGLRPGAAQRPAAEEMRRMMEERMEQRRRLREERMRGGVPGRRFPGGPRRFQRERPAPPDQPEDAGPPV